VKPFQPVWRLLDRMGLFVSALVVVLVMLVVALVMADKSLGRNADEQATLDATTSAKIVAQEVELAGVELHELSVRWHGGSTGGGPAGEIGTAGLEKGIRAVWLLDSLGADVVDSVSWNAAAAALVPPEAVLAMGREVAATRHLQVADIKAPGRNRTTGQALIGEPIIQDGRVINLAVALVDERMLLASAASAASEGRSFLALLIDGDTVAQTPHLRAIGRQSEPVRLPLPGSPEWYVISGRAPVDSTPRWTIWGLAAIAFGMLFAGFMRERRQAIRVSERSVELERLSAELLRANRMKSEFLANVSHELRTPLNAIVGFVDLLRDGGYGVLLDSQTGPVERIATSAARLRNLVDQVLDMAKIAAGRLDVHLETVAVRPFLVNVVSELEPLVQERGLKISIATEGTVAKIATDPTHLRQILVNLLGNALKYTQKGSIQIVTRVDKIGPPPRSLMATGQHMVVKIDQLKSWFAVDVVDSGIGIAEADQERIFEEFEQVRTGPSQDGKERGTGLGLPISRRLAALLGGDISVESVVGRGSTFTLWLPMRD